MAQIVPNGAEMRTLAEMRRGFCGLAFCAAKYNEALCKAQIPIRTKKLGCISAPGGRLYGNFGTASPDYYGTAYQGLSAWERKYRSVWTTTSYDPVLKKTNTVEVRKKLILHMNGKIEITKLEKK